MLTSEFDLRRDSTAFSVSPSTTQTGGPIRGKPVVPYVANTGKQAQLPGGPICGEPPVPCSWPNLYLGGPMLLANDTDYFQQAMVHQYRFDGPSSSSLLRSCRRRAWSEEVRSARRHGLGRAVYIGRQRGRLTDLAPPDTAQRLSTLLRSSCGPAHYAVASPTPGGQRPTARHQPIRRSHRISKHQMCPTRSAVCKG